MEVSSDGDEFVLVVPQLPRGLLQDLGVGHPEAPGLPYAIMLPARVQRLGPQAPRLAEGLDP